MRKDFGCKPLLFPMPVLVVAAYGEDDIPCAMTAAWGSISSADKISMCLTPTHKTVKNILERKAFTVSMADAEHIVEADYLGMASGNDVKDKVARTGLHLYKSEKVDAPLIEEYKMALECELLSYDVDSHIMVGKIVNVCADESVLNEAGNIDPAKLRPVTFDPANNKYLELGQVVEDAFAHGKDF